MIAFHPHLIPPIRLHKLDNLTNLHTFYQPSLILYSIHLMYIVLVLALIVKVDLYEGTTYTSHDWSLILYAHITHIF